MQGIYEQRLCAFVDILGFKDFVRRSIDFPTLQEKLRRALRKVVRARPVWEHDHVDLIEARLRQEGVPDPHAGAERLANEYAAAVRGSNFSDCLVLSATLNDRVIIRLLTSLLDLSGDLAEELGVYVRGAVSLGQLCHEEELCFGPALIEAYELEKNVAVYPRIVFSPEAYKEVSQVNLRSLGSFALREDVDDGSQFLDFLNQTTNPPFVPPPDLWEIRRQLHRQLFSIQGKDPKIRKKLVWLADYFNLVLKETPTLTIKPLSVGT